MVKRRPTEIVQVNLRLQEQLRSKIQRAAEGSGRSFNQWIVAAAEEKLRGAELATIVRKAVTDTGAALIREVRGGHGTGETDE